MSDGDLTPSESAFLVLEEAETLIWALLDDQLDAAETTKLAKLLEGNDQVRRRYIECVQLHVDLQDHFAGARAEGSGRSATPVLPNLMSGGTPGAGAPVVE
jgi:anti-sigma factor RsiW